MHISLQTKGTTLISCATGIVTLYFAPKRMIAGLALGVFLAHLNGSDELRQAKGHDQYFREKAVNALGESSLPGWTTTILSALSCYLTVAKVALPVIVGISLNTLCILGAGLFLGYTMRKFAYIKEVETWMNEQRDDWVKQGLMKQLKSLSI